MKKIVKEKKELLKEFVLDSKFVQFIIGLVVLLVGVLLYLIPHTKILSIRCICWVGRIIDVNFLENLSFLFIKNLFLQDSKNNNTVLAETCLNSDFFRKSSDIYSIENESSKVSLFRDLIVLKEKSGEEKGIILVKYTPAFDAFYYHFDFDKICKDYYVVLEPSWAGACDPSFLLYWRKSKFKNIIVQALEPKDYRFVKRLGGNFSPIDIGSSDWTDSDVFTFEPDAVKRFDLIMVSNWGGHKKHKELFRALAKVNKKLTILLVGFPWGGRTKGDIEQEIKEFKLHHVFVIKENVSTDEVSRLLNRSKVFLLLSKKEGGNKSIIESFFVNVPAILYENFIGGIQAKINNKTGILSSYKDLPANIEFMLESYEKFSPRPWIVHNSGSSVSTCKLNDLLKNISKENGEVWNKEIAEKVNSPNLKYKDLANDLINWQRFYADYKR